MQATVRLATEMSSPLMRQSWNARNGRLDVQTRASFAPIVPDTSVPSGCERFAFGGEARDAIVGLGNLRDITDEARP